MKTTHDYLIIGAGPAGLQLGYFLERAGRDYVMLERNSGPGSFFEQYPRNRELISFNKRFSVYDDPEINLRWDWNSLLTDDYSLPFREFSERIYPTADEMVHYLRAFHEATHLRTRFDTDVRRISKLDDGTFRLQTSSDEEFLGRTLIVATGLWTPYIPDIRGIEHAEGYEDTSFVASDYTKQRLLIIGKGNSAFELADRALSHASLIHLASPQSIQMAWKTRHAGHVRGHYTAVLDSYQLKTLNGALDCHIEEIRKDGDQYEVTVRYVHADGELETMVYDRVVRATGFRFDTDIFDENCRPNVINLDRFPDMTPTWESPTCPGMFFAGTLMQARDFKQAGSTFIDGFRYNVRSLFHLLQQRDFGVPYPSTELAMNGEAIADMVLRRVCQTSSLWTQFGHLSDAVVVDPTAGTAVHYPDLPYDEARGPRFGDRHVFVVTFEWGKVEGDVFMIDRHPSANTAHTNVFLHPIIRHFHRERLISEHHVLEDLFGMFDGRWESGTVLARGKRQMDRYHHEEHVVPLQQYFDEALTLLARPQPMISDIQALTGPEAEALEPSPSSAEGAE